jgi:hypothetical protein
MRIHEHDIRVPARPGTLPARQRSPVEDSDDSVEFEPDRRGVPGLQAKLTLGPPADRYEREADRVALQVAGQAGGDRRVHQDRLGQQGGSARPAAIQRLRGTPGGGVDATMERAVAQARGSGQALPSRLRWQVEQTLGADLGAVRIHTGPRVDQLNEALSSRAFTVGGDVFVRRDAYRPGTPAGAELLAHELTHTVQQGASPPRHDAQAPALAAPPASRPFSACSGSSWSCPSC